MFRSRNAIKKRKYKTEIKVIDEEINRSQRYNLNFSVLVVDISHSVPRGLSRLLPGNVVSFHLLQKYIRSYDHMIGPNRRRYYIIFAQTNRDGANSVKQRIHKLAKEQNWGDLTIGTAVYPEDGKTSRALLSKAISSSCWAT
jgi:GGDEF domain-containing protein